MRKTFIFFLLTFLLIPSAYALGVSPASVDIDYAEGLYELTYRIRSDSNVDGIVIIEPQGAFAQYIDAPEYVEVGARQTKEVPIVLNLPSGLEREYIGPQRLNMRFTESEGTGEGMFTTRVRIITRITIHFPYPGQYVEPVDFKVDNSNEGESAKASWTIVSRGDEPTTFDSEIFVFDSEGEILFTKEYPSQTLEVGSRLSRSDNLPTEDLPSAKYSAIKVVNFEGNQVNSSSSSFRIGIEDVDLLYISPRVFEQDAISEVTLRVVNLWNDVFDNVYATIQIGDYSTTTPSISLNRLQERTIDHFINTNNLELGEHEMLITVFFGDNEKEFTETITITDEILREETPSAGSRDTTSIMIIVLSVLLVIAIALAIFIALKKN